MTPQGQAAPPQESWFAKVWKWLAAVGCLLPSLCCGSFAVLGLIMPNDEAAARVDCGTPGPEGVDCDVQRTAGTGALEACWDLEITCANKGVMTGHACGGINEGKKSAKVNMPVADFSNQEACDAPKAGAVVNVNVRSID